jgi:uncharacterized membrane protein
LPFHSLVAKVAMSHRRAAALMVLVTLLWSIAGVVSRHLDAADGFEVTFWRSLFNALALSVALTRMRGPGLWRELANAAWPVWFSGLCWSVMFTAFMLAMTLTTVANVLVTMAIGPLITALFTRIFLQHRLPARTWLAIVVAGAGIAWMFGQEAQSGLSLVGTLVAFAVPLAAALNFTTLQHVGRSRAAADGACSPEHVAGSTDRCRTVGRLDSADGLSLPGLESMTSVCWHCSESCNWRFPVCWWCACRANCRRRRLPCSVCSKSSSVSPGPGSVPANSRQQAP